MVVSSVRIPRRSRSLGSCGTGKDARSRGTGRPATWNRSRPGFVEADAVQRAAYLARVTGCASTSCIRHRRGVGSCALQRLAGAAITIETCPHYLTHDISFRSRHVGKINPPLRCKRDCDALWRAISTAPSTRSAPDHVHRDICGKVASIWDASPGARGWRRCCQSCSAKGTPSVGFAGADGCAYVDQCSASHGTGASERCDRARARCGFRDRRSRSRNGC